MHHKLDFLRAISLTALVVGMSGVAAQAQTPITTGNLVVLQVGSGSAVVSGAATADLLDEYTVGGMQVQQITVQSTAQAAGTGVNYALTNSNSAGSEGGLTLSGNGKYIVFGGYNVTAGTASVAASAPSATANQRVVGLLNVSTGTVDTTTGLTDAFNGNNIRSAYTTDGTNIYVAGTAGSGQTATAAVRYTTLGATTTTQLESTATNLRRVNGYNGQLYVNAGATGDYNVATVGTGFPTTSGQTLSVLPGLPNASGTNGYDFFFTNPNTLYIADQTAGLEKYTFSSSSSTWSLAYASGTATGGAFANFTSVSGFTQSGTANTFYASTAGNIYSISDTGSGFAPTSIATAPMNTVFRGLVFNSGIVSSGAMPEPGVLPLVAEAGALVFGFGLMRRRRNAA